MALSIDNKLGVNRFKTDNYYAHIEINEECKDIALIQKVVAACPAKLYRYEDGIVRFNYEGCLECGTCRVLAGGKLIQSWNHPMGGMGIRFRKG